MLNGWGMRRAWRRGRDGREGRLVSLDELIVASNANVGGPATAASFAGLLGRPNLIVPATLYGTLGYGIATTLGVGLFHSLLSWSGVQYMVKITP